MERRCSHLHCVLIEIRTTTAVYWMSRVFSLIDSLDIPTANIFLLDFCANYWAKPCWTNIIRHELREWFDRELPADAAILNAKIVLITERPFKYNYMGHILKGTYNEHSCDRERIKYLPFCYIKIIPDANDKSRHYFRNI